MNKFQIAIVVVNWNGWEDTVRCIAACGHLKSFNGAVIIIDNGSTDDSFQKILSWSRNEFEVSSSSSFSEISRLEKRSDQPLKFHIAGNANAVAEDIMREGLISRGLYIIRSEVNLGFGGGNNVGLRLAMLDPNCKLFWLLNSDAIPKSDALKELEMTCLSLTKPFVSGSVLLNYDDPMTIQALGSNVNYLTLRTTHVLKDASVRTLDSYDSVYKTGAPVGAAMMINRSYIKQFGMFDERMFLYYEELDLVSRLKNRQSFICTKSFVYHKGGQSTNAGQMLADRATRADYEFLKSRTLLARKIGLSAALMSVLTMLFSLVKRLYLRRIDLALNVLPSFIDGWRKASDKGRK